MRISRHYDDDDEVSENDDDDHYLGDEVDGGNDDFDQLEDLSDQLEKMNLVWGTAVIIDLKTNKT